MFEPAREEDMPFIRDCVQRFRLDGEHLEPSQLIVLRREGRIVAFGRIKPYPDCFELGTVGVVEEERGKGLGEQVVRELIRRFPSRDVWITTDLTDYFARFGFAPADDVPASLRDKLARICGTLRDNVVAMKRVKP